MSMCAMWPQSPFENARVRPLVAACPRIVAAARRRFIVPLATARAEGAVPVAALRYDTDGLEPKSATSRIDRLRSSVAPRLIRGDDDRRWPAPLLDHPFAKQMGVTLVRSSSVSSSHRTACRE